jgi:predicted TIM-barrel fold metal-dependent hydrolase
MPSVTITNCHTHTFTHDHTPDRFAGLVAGLLLRVPWIRRALLFLMRHLDPDKRGKLTRYAQILRVSYEYGSQEGVFKLLRSYYPRGTRFVVLPMDMELMNAGRVREPIDLQHEQLADLRDRYPELVVPFAAADARRADVVEKTKHLIEERGFRGIKLYPPIGYHPNDPALRPLYDYAAEHRVPVMTHCSRPASVQYRGKPTDRMRTDPATGARLSLGRKELLTLFTDPDAYVPILDARPSLTLCLAHFGGAGDWEAFLDDPWDALSPTGEKSWLAKILDMIRSGAYENLYTDVSYTVFANDEYVYLLRALLSDETLRRRVLFGSDFYVVESAELEERRRSVRVRAVLGEELWQALARDNPRSYLGEA